MSKFTINTINKTQTYDFNKATIITDQYSRIIKINEIHSDKSAKFIIKDSDRILAFLVKLPFVRVNAKGDIYLWTTSTFEEATMENTITSKEDTKIIKKQISKLKRKVRIGVSPKEIYELEKLEVELSTIKISKKYINPKTGGGF